MWLVASALIDCFFSPSTQPYNMRIVSFGEGPAANTPRRRVIEQPSSPAQGLGTSTKSTSRRLSVLANNVATVSSTQGSHRDGKQRQEDIPASESESISSSSRPGSSEGDAGSLKENEFQDDGIVKDIAMDLVTSASTGSLMRQAMSDASTHIKRPKKRKGSRRIPLHGA
jgi:hypothetical protein